MSAVCEPTGVDITTCAPGIQDCCYGDSFTGRLLMQCAEYSSAYQPPGELPWLRAAAFVTMALMAFGIGANDVGNSFGTSVGSGAISMRAALIIGGLMDWLGAALLGAGVSGTIRNGVSDVQRSDCWACGYCDSRMGLYMLGMTAALLATAAFLILSSSATMPVSTTHAIVGSIAGMTIVGTSFSCLKYRTLGFVAASWVTSPLVAGVIGAALHEVLLRSVLLAPDPDQRALQALPWLAASTTAVMAALVLLKSHLTSSLAWYWVLFATVAVFLVASWVGTYVAVPHIRQRIVSSQVDARVAAVELAAIVGAERRNVWTASNGAGTRDESQGLKASDSLSDVSLDGAGVDGNDWDAVMPRGPVPPTPAALPGLFGNEEYTEAQGHALFVFRYLLVFVAALESFAHGANDTGNATGAFSAVWIAYRNGLSSCDLSQTPPWVMVAGGFFVFLGVNALGHRVIRTMGFGLTSINFLRGFCIEFASTASVVLATLLDLPVSTTHCQVGAVIFVGWAAFGARHVKWSMFGWIALTWAVTLPASAALAAAITAVSEGLVKR